MKLTHLKIAAICTLLFSGFSTSAQIILNQEDFPSANDQVTVSQALDLQIDYAATGSNYQWDFSNLNSLNQVTRVHSPATGLPLLINISYGPFAVTAYRASYFMPFTDLPLNQFGNLLPIQIENVFQYTKKTAQRLTLLGYSAEISGQGIPIKSDTIETKYNFPLEYGDDYTSKGYTNLDLSMFVDAQWVQSRKRHTVVDGWGQITTPYGTFDVLRVQHRIEETDSLSYEGTSFGLQIPVMYEYEWIAKGEDAPILKVVTTELMGVETVITVEYKDNPPLGIDQIASEELLVFPNPVTDELTINWKSGEKNVVIYDIDGSIVNQFSFDGITHKINTSTLKAGMYFISINNTDGTVNKSFVKK